MNEYVFSPSPQATVDVHGGGLFPVRRIFCIGKNYADHVAEMGGDVKSDPPVFFSKPADAVTPSASMLGFPSATESLHFEGELVIALKAGGQNLSGRKEAGALIFGAACGCDLTRRDLQAAAKKAGWPWDSAKAFDRSAPVGAIGKVQDFPPDDFNDAHIVTRVNGEVRQDAPLSSMIWNVQEIICELSRFFELKAGDLIFTGTPAGVGALSRGDRVEVRIGALPALTFSLCP